METVRLISWVFQNMVKTYLKNIGKILTTSETICLNNFKKKLN